MNVEKVFLNECWLGVGGNTPWGIPGIIKEIKIYEIDPRNFNGADSAQIVIIFDNGKEVRARVKEYMYLTGDAQ
jgi:hypothetical protein